MKFKQLIKIISLIDKVFICMRETLQYENYYYMEKNPNKYGEMNYEKESGKDCCNKI